MSLAYPILGLIAAGFGIVGFLLNRAAERAAEEAWQHFSYGDHPHLPTDVPPFHDEGIIL